MKKMKFFTSLAVFLMAFFVMGVQDANAQVQSSSEAYMTLKTAHKTMVDQGTMPSAESNNGLSADATASTISMGLTKSMINLTINEMNGSASTPAAAINAVYTNLLAQTNGAASRVAMLDASKEYIETLVGL